MINAKNANITTHQVTSHHRFLLGRRPTVDRWRGMYSTWNRARGMCVCSLARTYLVTMSTFPLVLLLLWKEWQFNEHASSKNNIQSEISLFCTLVQMACPMKLTMIPSFSVRFQARRPTKTCSSLTLSVPSISPVRSGNLCSRSKFMCDVKS